MRNFKDFALWSDDDIAEQITMEEDEGWGSAYDYNNEDVLAMLKEIQRLRLLLKEQGK